MSEPLGRVPPHNLDAEASVLGGILLRNDALDAACDRGLTLEDFYHPTHRAIFEAMVDLRVEREPIDILTVANRLKKLDRGRHAAISETLLADLAGRVPTASNVGYYANIVHEKARLRNVIATSGDILSKAYRDDASADDVVEEAQKRFRACSQQKIRIFTAAELAKESTRRRRSNDPNDRPIPIGYPDIDAKIGGLLRKRLFIIGGRPKVGKSTFAQGIVDNLTARGVSVGVISLEEEGPDYSDAMIGRSAEIDSLKIVRGEPLTFIEERRWDEAEAMWSKRPLFACDARRLSMRDVCQVARRMKADHNIDVLKIDYLGQVRRPGKRKEHEEIEEQLSELFACLQELNIAGLLVVQINRGAELTTARDKRPRIHQLQGAGAIEQWAYCILMIYRECMHNPKADGNIAEILIGGVKRGESNRAVRMLWVPHLPAVRNLPANYVSPIKKPGWAASKTEAEEYEA